MVAKRKIVVGILIAVVVFAASPLLIFIAYDLYAFQTKREEVAILIAAGVDGPSELPHTVSALLLCSHRGQTVWPAAKILMLRLGVTDGRVRMAYWHTLGALWSGIAYVHLTEAERLRLIGGWWPYLKGKHGLSAGSNTRFGKQLSELSMVEVAELIALGKSPSLEHRSVELKEQTQEIVRVCEGDAEQHAAPDVHASASLRRGRG